jgi:imidazole glycerol-phosphate synthase subunit HisH
MQMLAASSEEGKLPGMGWIDGSVKKFVIPTSNTTMHIPHMGWNNISPLVGEPLLSGLESDDRHN